MITDIFADPVFHVQLDEDLKSLIDFCSKLKEGRMRSNVGGFQSDNLDKDSPELQSLISHILFHGNSFSKEHLCLKNDIYLNNIWVNKNYYKDYNEQHVHLDSVLSGVFYVKTNPQSGDLKFFRNNSLDVWMPDRVIKKFNYHNSTLWSFRPEDNYLFLFPAWLKHSVTPNLSQEERISISFNIAIKK